MSDQATASPWPRRSAYLTAFLAFPLLLLGGTVTSLRAGMAVRVEFERVHESVWLPVFRAMV